MTDDPTRRNHAANNNGNGNGNGSAVKSLVDHVEQIKENLKGVIRDLSAVVDTVKAAEKEKRATDKEIDAIRTKLRQIQNVDDLSRRPSSQPEPGIFHGAWLFSQEFNGSDKPKNKSPKSSAIAVGCVIAYYVLMWLLPYIVMFLALCGAWYLLQEYQTEQSTQPAVTHDHIDNLNFIKRKEIIDNGKQQQRQQRPSLDTHPGRRFIEGERPLLAWM